MRQVNPQTRRPPPSHAREPARARPPRTFRYSEPLKRPMPRLYEACGAARVRRQGALTAVAPDAGSSRNSMRSFSTQPCAPDAAQCQREKGWKPCPSPLRRGMRCTILCCSNRHCTRRCSRGSCPWQQRRACGWDIGDALCQVTRMAPLSSGAGRPAGGLALHPPGRRCWRSRRGPAGRSAAGARPGTCQHARCLWVTDM